MEKGAFWQSRSTMVKRPRPFIKNEKCRKTDAFTWTTDTELCLARRRPFFVAYISSSLCSAACAPTRSPRQLRCSMRARPRRFNNLLHDSHQQSVSWICVVSDHQRYPLESGDWHVHDGFHDALGNVPREKLFIHDALGTGTLTISSTMRSCEINSTSMHSSMT